MLEVRNGSTVTAPLADAPEWTSEAAWSLYRLPFNDLLFKAQSIHRRHFDPNRVQLSKLLNTAFGWATTLLFGKVPSDRQIYLSLINFSFDEIMGATTLDLFWS